MKLIPGMLTNRGRVLEILPPRLDGDTEYLLAEGSTIWHWQYTRTRNGDWVWYYWSPTWMDIRYAVMGPAPELDDEATFLLCLSELARRVNLKSSGGGFQWFCLDCEHGVDGWELSGGEDSRFFPAFCKECTKVSGIEMGHKGLATRDEKEALLAALEVADE